MKNTTFLVLCFFVSALISFGQSKDSKIRELLDLSNYEYDIDAGAAIIYDYGETNFYENDRGFYTKFTRRQRIKFFNDSKLKFGEISIPIYYGDRSIEEIEYFKAAVFNLNDGIISTTYTDKNALLEEKYNKNSSVFKVAVAGLKAGSVLDVEYTVISPFFFRLHDWQFQYEIPVLYSEYIAHMIPFYSYSYIIKGTNKLDVLSSEVENDKHRAFGVMYQKTLYKFAMSTIPAFYQDEYISSENDYLISLDFQLNEINHLDGYKEKIISTWPNLTENLIKDEEDFGYYLRGSKKLAKKILSNTKFTYVSKQQYLEQLVGYVKTNFDWNGKRGIYANVKPGDFERIKKGNTASINLFLTALLREAGFNAEPVIISTRDNGKIYTSYPFLHYFNYVIVLTNIDGKDYLLDATEKQSFFDQLPPICINDVGLIVKKGEEKWVILNSNNVSNNVSTFFFQLNNGGDSLKCSYNCKETGYYALNSKISYKNDPDKFIEEQINPLFDEIISTKVTEIDSLKTFRYSATGQIKPTKIENYISIKPFLNTISTENPFKKKERSYPVDFVYSRKKVFSSQIMLPEGARMIKQPETIDVDNNNFTLKYDVSTTGNAILINAEYYIKKPVFEPSLYPGLRNMFDNLVKYLNQNIEIQLQK